LRWLCGIGRKKVVAIGVRGVVAEAAGGMGKEGGENGQAEAAEDAQLVVLRGRKTVVWGSWQERLWRAKGIMGLAREGRLEQTWGGMEREVEKVVKSFF
jgi:hypothetical protein